MLFISPTYIYILIFGIVLLSTSMIINLGLLKAKPKNETLIKVHTIIKSWWLIIGTVLFFGAFGPYGFLFLFTALNLLISQEYFKRSQLNFIKSKLLILLILSTSLQSYLLYDGQYELFSAFPVLFFILSFPPLLFHSKSLENLPQLSAGYLCVLLLTHSIFYLPALILVGPKLFSTYDSSLLSFFVIMGLTQANDIFQFICGKIFGRKKVVPHLSPNKTEAGFIGGITLTTLVGGYLFYQIVKIPLPLSFLFGFSISFLGIFGDLTFSSIKRYLKIKDFSDALPGHGGLIDRLDSLIFTAPALFHLIKFYLGVNL